MSKNNDESEPVSRVWVDPDWISRDEYRALVAQMDAAYRERNQLVALLAGLFPSSLERHPDEDTEWEDDWRWICFIDFPGFQATWHLQDAELPLFDHVPRHQGRQWDGHTTEEKYQRVAQCATEVAGGHVIVCLNVESATGSQESEEPS